MSDTTEFSADPDPALLRLIDRMALGLALIAAVALILLALYRMLRKA